MKQVQSANRSTISISIIFLSWWQDFFYYLFCISLFLCDSKYLHCSDDVTTLSLDSGNTQNVITTRTPSRQVWRTMLRSLQLTIVLVYDPSESKGQTGLVKNGANSQTGFSSLISVIKRVVMFKQSHTTYWLPLH